jgi:hypothetical protein
MKRRASLVFSLSLLSAACAVAPSDDQSSEDLGSIQQPERWSSADDPSIFARRLERNIERLPRQGSAAQLPWAGSYWPTHIDSVNYRWDGPDSLSPSMKYEKAFGGSRVEDQVSRYFGVDSQSSAKACTEDRECDQSLIEVCGKRTGASSGRCVPTWFGICDAWASASLLFPEPQREVTVNGVTFKVNDIKALVTLVSTKTAGRLISLRCNANDMAGGISYDAHGRATTSECRDSNPGTFHIILTNYLGLQRKSVVQDRTFDYQVWNHPIRSYKVVEGRVVSAQEANRLVGGNGGPRYLFNNDARMFVYVKNDVSYILESTPTTDGHLESSIDSFTGHTVYEYVLELNRKGSIIGGEWVGSSKREHPDFLWLPVDLGSNSVAGGAISDEQVKKLAAASVSR